MISSTRVQCPHTGCGRMFKLNKAGTSKCLGTHVAKLCPYRSAKQTLSKSSPTPKHSPNTLNDRFGTLTDNTAGKQVLLAGGGNVMRLIGAFRKGMVCTIKQSHIEAFIGSERYFAVFDSELKRRMEYDCILEPEKNPQGRYSSTTNVKVGESGSWYNGWKDHGESSSILKQIQKARKGARMEHYNGYGLVAWNWPHLLYNRKISGLCVKYKHYTKVLDILDEFLRSSELSYIRLCDIESILVYASKSFVNLPQYHNLHPTSIRARLLKASTFKYSYIPANTSTGLNHFWYETADGKGNLDYYVNCARGSIVRNPDGTGRRRGRQPVAAWGHQNQMKLHHHEIKYFEECDLPFKKNGRFIGPHYIPKPEYVPKY